MPIMRQHEAGDEDEDVYEQGVEDDGDDGGGNDKKTVVL